MTVRDSLEDGPGLVEVWGAAADEEPDEAGEGAVVLLGRRLGRLVHHLEHRHVVLVYLDI